MTAASLSGKSDGTASLVVTSLIPPIYVGNQILDLESADQNVFSGCMEFMLVN